MITYIEKSAKLHALISAAGFRLWQENGVWKSNNDAEVQAIIDTYDELPNYKKDKILALKLAGVEQARAVFPGISSFDDLDLVGQIMQSVAPAARAPMARVTKLSQIWSAGVTAASAVNSATTKAQVDAVTVNWPA